MAELTINPSTTHVGWIGTDVMGRYMCSHLLKAGYTLTVFNPTLSKAQPLIDLGAHLADSSPVVASQSAVDFSIVGYPSDVRSVVLDATTDALSGLRPGGVLVGSSIDAPITEQFAN